MIARIDVHVPVVNAEVDAQVAPSMKAKVTSEPMKLKLKLISRFILLTSHSAL